MDDRYDVVRPLGSGGMGEVYLARDRVLGRDVALKVLRKQYAGDDEFAERFKREAMSAASLSHPNIIQVYDRGETEEGASYIAMEYVPGGTLKERISREGPLEAADAAGLGAQVAEALGAAHDRGMVHRDIKPQNVLLAARGGAKVADFGIARAGSSATISRTGSVMGTAGYMSPEQALGKPATPKSDLYSLGVVLYEALTGELPYTADNPIAVSMKHVNEPLRPPIELNPRIPKGMNALVTKLLAKDPEDRYADAEELADDLWRVNRGLEPVAAGVGRKQGPGTQRTALASTNVTNKMQRPWPGPVPYRRKRRLPWLLIALAAILFTLGVLGSVQAVLGPDAMKAGSTSSRRQAISWPARRTGEGARSGRAHQERGGEEAHRRRARGRESHFVSERQCRRRQGNRARHRCRHPSGARHRREPHYQLGTTTFLIRELVRLCPVERRTRGFRLGKLFRVGAASTARGSPGCPDACGRGE